MTHDSLRDLQINPVNQDILAAIATMSAHSDISEVLTEAVKPLGDVQLFCPDWSQYRYVVASTKQIIFAAAFGMDTIAFRLDRTFKDRAIVTGGYSNAQFGNDWVAFQMFRSDWPKVDVHFWSRKAYESARTCESSR